MMEVGRRNNLLRLALLIGVGGAGEYEDNRDANEVDEGRYDEYCPRMKLNVDKWRHLGDPTFKKHFRMNRCIFESLVLTVGNHMTVTGRLEKKGLPVDIALMMTIWILATPDSFRSVGEQFECDGGSVHNQYRTMIAVLRELRDTFIQWPSDIEKEVISAEFEDCYGYPSVIGCIDGCHIRITAPLEQPQMYENRHHDYSILVQAVCDHQMLFRDVYVGEPGAVGDAGVFHRSALSHYMLQPEGITGDFHLLGDGAYPCTSQLLVPFRDYGNLTQRQRTHNYTLSKCRCTIERAFALLKGKWRRLKLFPNKCLEYAVDHITACLVLHNFVILEGEALERVDNGPPFVWQEGQYQQLLDISKEGGVRKRDYIATMLIHV